jgi:eukaryotic-like serine/threonine-protein kinase
MNDENLFHLALEKPAGERSAFLDRACEGDVARRRRVEVLLRSHETPDSFLAEPAVDPGVMEEFGQGLTADAAPGRPDGEVSIRKSPPEGPGDQIGPYKLLQQLGEGGMGTVFMAEQARPVRRKVALKIIKLGMDSLQVIARFEAERQALAVMDHVNIARVIDAGTTDSGRPYFVMELVHGVPITKYCDDNQLSPRQRLELFVPVCQAIQHAHQKGIIHRDIKPSNVMVTLHDGRPVPKVIDFGVAKATEQRLTERTLFTQYGTLVGTLEYMSPEQAEMSALGVDTRSDIYSLGVLLYELLTGSTPLSHKRVTEAAYGEILRMIKEEEPPKPSTRLSDSGEALASISARRHMEPAKLSSLMRGELDWIVMKTLEKDRNRRYETASGFAADVQHYLNDETVEACPPSTWYRFRKFYRRNKQALITASVVGSAILGGIVIASWQAVVATRTREAALANNVSVNKQAAIATGISESLKQILGSLNPDAAKGPDYTVRQLLDDSSDRIEANLAELPEAAADVHTIVGRAYGSVGERAKADRHLKRALELRRQAFDAHYEKLAATHPSGDLDLFAHVFVNGLVAWICFDLAVLMAIAYFTRATMTRIAGALAGGAALGLLLPIVNAAAEAWGWWRIPMDQTPGGLLMFFGTVVGASRIFLITWRVARRFGWCGLAVLFGLGAVVVPLRSYAFAEVFPETIEVGPGVMPALASAAAFVGIVPLGHAVMRLVAGPAGADSLARLAGNRLAKHANSTAP